MFTTLIATGYDSDGNTRVQHGYRDWSEFYNDSTSLFSTMRDNDCTTYEVLPA